MRPSALFVALLLSVTLVNAARADVIPPEVDACRNKQVGDACISTSQGVCQSQTCSKLDYAAWDRDASTSPPTASYACVKCMPTSSTETTTDTNTDTSTVTVPPTTTDTSVSTSTEDDSPPSSGDDGSCSFGHRSTVRRIAPWMLAGAFSLLFLFGRRRRR